MSGRSVTGKTEVLSQLKQSPAFPAGSLCPRRTLGLSLDSGNQDGMGLLWSLGWSQLKLVTWRGGRKASDAAGPGHCSALLPS